MNTTPHHARWNAWLTLSALLALTAVAAGAFGAHALKSRLSVEKLASYEVGVRYQMYHALALMVLTLVYERARSRGLTAARVLIFIGVLMFSGSIYILALLGWRWMGPITPIGGGLMIIGWLVAALSARTRTKCCAHNAGNTNHAPMA